MKSYSCPSLTENCGITRWLVLQHSVCFCIQMRRTQDDPSFRWFKFTLKPPNRITGDKLRLAIWDTSFWTFWVKFGHNGP